MSTGITKRIAFASYFLLYHCVSFHPVQGEHNLKEAPKTPPPGEKAPGEPEPEENKPNKTQQLKKVFKEYGAVGVSFHVGISLMSLGMFYVLISR